MLEKKLGQSKVDGKELATLLREQWGVPFIIFSIGLLIVDMIALSFGLFDVNQIALYAFYALLVGVLLQGVCFFKNKRNAEVKEIAV